MSLIPSNKSAKLDWQDIESMYRQHGADRDAGGKFVVESFPDEIYFYRYNDPRAHNGITFSHLAQIAAQYG